MPGYTYEYDYSGLTSTSIMGVGSKATGGSIKGRLVIEPADESTVHIAVSNRNFRQTESFTPISFRIALGHKGKTVPRGHC